jgi:hypothetical protein
MKTKTLLLYVVGALILFGLGYTLFGGRKYVQGFQNPTEPTFTADGAVQIGGKRCVVRAVDPQTEEGKKIAAGKPIKGFPTFMLELPNGVLKEYKGERTTDGYLAFLNQELGGGV